MLCSSAAGGPATRPVPHRAAGIQQRLGGGAGGGSQTPADESCVPVLPEQDEGGLALARQPGHALDGRLGIFQVR